MNDTIKADLSLALVHWPVVDKSGRVVCTNVTNFDVHDIARAAKVYGIRDYFIVNRIKEQLMFVSRLQDHWVLGTGSVYNPKRRSALGVLRPVEYLSEAVLRHARKPLVVATSAKATDFLPRVSFRQLRQDIRENDRPVLLVFGTGFGLHESALRECDVCLEPIQGVPPLDYRHLSVRSAVSICLDRIVGEW